MKINPFSEKFKAWFSGRDRVLPPETIIAEPVDIFAKRRRAWKEARDWLRNPFPPSDYQPPKIPHSIYYSGEQ